MKLMRDWNAEYPPKKGDNPDRIPRERYWKCGGRKHKLHITHNHSSEAPKCRYCKQLMKPSTRAEYDKPYCKKCGSLSLDAKNNCKKCGK